MRLIKQSFSAGEFSREVQTRSDLELYDLGAKTMLNFVVNYGGGAFKRMGTRFSEFLAKPEDHIRFFTFKFSQNVSSAYVLVFGRNYIRFLQDGRYVLEDGSVTAPSVDNGTRISKDNHGLVDGELLSISDYPDTVMVADAGQNSFRVKNFLGEFVQVQNNVTYRKVMKLDNPYEPDDIWGVTYYQYLNQVKFAHPDYRVHILTRTGGGWTMEVESRTAGKPLNLDVTVTNSGSYIQDIFVKDDGAGLGPDSEIEIDDPTGSGFRGALVIDDGGELESVEILSPGHNYTNPEPNFTDYSVEPEVKIVLSESEAGFIVAVSAVMDDGSETGICRPVVVTDSVDFTQTKGWARYNWTSVPGAVKYNVYRSLVIPQDADAHIGMALGLLGVTRGTRFLDNNVVPDFTQQPKIYRDPFANRAVASVEILNEGSGYAQTSNLHLSGAEGSGFEGWPIVERGKIVGVYIADHGRNYDTSSALVVQNAGGGSGASFKVRYTQDSGNDPSVSFRFQGRDCYAGSLNDPMTVWGSRVRESDFSIDDPETDASPFEHRLDLEEVNPIRAAVSGSQGLLLFTSSDVALLRGLENELLTSKSALSEPQSAMGMAAVRPVKVEDDIVYIQEAFRGVQILVPEARWKYSSQELSTLARHLFDGTRIRSLAFAYRTEKRGYGVFANGDMFALTLDRDQNVHGFSRLQTTGQFRDVTVLDVGTGEHIYLQVEREIDGVQVKTVEILREEATSYPEDAIYLDGCVSIAKERRGAIATPSGLTGEIEVRTDADAFTSNDEGRVIGLGNGRGYVTEFNTARRVQVELTRDITETGLNGDIRSFTSGEWWVNPTVLSVSGIPYEGMTVSVMGDGAPQKNKTVVDGAIDLDQPSAIVHVGFPYLAEVETLSPNSAREIIEGLPYSVSNAFMKFKRAGYFEAGARGGALYPFLFRDGEAWSEPTRHGQDEKLVSLSGSWDKNGSILIRQNNGLPLEILQMVYEVDVGN